MSTPYKNYSGSVDYAASLLESARVRLHLERCGLERRLWTENQANEMIKQWLPTIRERLAACEALVREIEDTITTVEEEQEAAKEIHHAA